MNNLLPLFKIMLSNTMYVKYGDLLRDMVKDNKELSILMQFLDKMHSKYPRDINFVEFNLYVLCNCVEKDKENLNSILKDIYNEDTDSIILSDLLADMQQRQKAYELAIAALDVSEGRREFQDLVILSNELNEDSKQEAEESQFVTNNLDDLYHDSVQKTGLRWRLQTLNTMLGSLRQGDFGFIFARPETGKTTFLASEVSHFASQAIGPILWLNNEEMGSKVQLRVYQATLGVTLTELFGDLDGNKKRFVERGGDKIKIFDNASIHKRQIEQLARELKPSLIIVDQVDKIKGFTDDREDLRLGSIYIFLREIAKQYCPVIGVSQAGATGEGKKWLTMDDVANAKTAKQAEADWILGIGKSHSDADEYVRYLHLSKNKLTGDLDTDPNLRHGKQSVIIDANIARYKDN